MAGNRKYKGEFYVYAFKLSIDDLLKTYHDENELLETYTEEELGASTVIIDILYWDKADKTGKAVTDYGDNLPDYEDTGYINIKTPIGAHIKLHNVDDNNWYEIDLTAGDNVIKLKIGTYYIDYINDKDMAERENSIVANNRIQIEPDNTIENAYSVSLDLAMQKYGIYTAPTKDAGNDRATKEIAEKGSGKTERTQVKADEEVKEKQKQNRLWVYVILVVIAIALFIAYKILKRKGGGKPL